MMSWFRKNTDVELYPLTGPDTYLMSEIHAEGFVRPWTDGEFENLLGRPSTSGFKAAASGRNNMAGFVLVALAADEAEILTLVTAKSSRRTGLGERLMRRVMAHVSNEGAQSLFLEVEDTNLPAIGLYQKLGFKQVGIRKNYYGGITASGGTALVMRLDLG